MTDTVTVRGYIATAPTQKYLPKTNIPVANFRLASTPRWFDNITGQWRESDTNWYTVNSFRALAHNAARSLQVGQPVLVTGRLKVKQFERNDGSQGTSIEIDATSIGHDLNYGLARFERISDRRPEIDETDRKFKDQVQGEQAQPAGSITSYPGASASEGQLPHQREELATAFRPEQQLSGLANHPIDTSAPEPSFGLAENDDSDEAVMTMTS